MTILQTSKYNIESYHQSKGVVLGYHLPCIHTQAIYGLYLHNNLSIREGRVSALGSTNQPAFNAKKRKPQLSRDKNCVLPHHNIIVNERGGSNLHSELSVYLLASFSLSFEELFDDRNVAIRKNTSINGTCLPPSSG